MLQSSCFHGSIYQIGFQRESWDLSPFWVIRFCGPRPGNSGLIKALLSSYNKWITEIADADARLLETLRRIRSGVFIYGKDTGQAPLLQSMCEDLGLPKVWGDPALTKPVPCQVRKAPE